LISPLFSRLGRRTRISAPHCSFQSTSSLVRPPLPLFPRSALPPRSPESTRFLSPLFRQQSVLARFLYTSFLFPLFYLSFSFLPPLRSKYCYLLPLIVLLISILHEIIVPIEPTLALGQRPLPNSSRPFSPQLPLSAEHAESMLSRVVLVERRFDESLHWSTPRYCYVSLFVPPGCLVLST